MRKLTKKFCATVFISTLDLAQNYLKNFNLNLVTPRPQKFFFFLIFFPSHSKRLIFIFRWLKISIFVHFVSLTSFLLVYTYSQILLLRAINVYLYGLKFQRRDASLSSIRIQSHVYLHHSTTDQRNLFLALCHIHKLPPLTYLSVYISYISMCSQFFFQMRFLLSYFLFRG